MNDVAEFCPVSRGRTPLHRQWDFVACRPIAPASLLPDHGRGPSAGASRRIVSAGLRQLAARRRAPQSGLLRPVVLLPFVSSCRRMHRRALARRLGRQPRRSPAGLVGEGSSDICTRVVVGGSCRVDGGQSRPRERRLLRVGRRCGVGFNYPDCAKHGAHHPSDTTAVEREHPYGTVVIALCLARLVLAWRRIDSDQSLV